MFNEYVARTLWMNMIHFSIMENIDYLEYGFRIFKIKSSQNTNGVQGLHLDLEQSTYNFSALSFVILVY